MKITFVILSIEKTQEEKLTIAYCYSVDGKEAGKRSIDVDLRGLYKFEKSTWEQIIADKVREDLRPVAQALEITTAVADIVNKENAL